mgnify:CR=1 FL=1
MGTWEQTLDAARAALEDARRRGQETIDAARDAERYESDAARIAVAKAEAERQEMERARAAERQAAETSHAAAAETLSHARSDPSAKTDQSFWRCVAGKCAQEGESALSANCESRARLRGCAGTSHDWRRWSCD